MIKVHTGLSSSRSRVNTLVVGYAGGLRISEILSSRVKNITTFDHFMKIFLVKRRMISLETGTFQSLLDLLSFHEQ